MVRSPAPPEARIVGSNHVVLVLSPLADPAAFDGFCGAVVTDLAQLPDLSGKVVYLSGDASKAAGVDLAAAARVFVIREHATGTWGGPGSLVDLGRLPVRVHAVGVYYRSFFDPDVDVFERVCGEHTFQSLTESTKPGTAHRTGIYLTPVTKQGEDLHFRLLRCSTNLSGPTDNFRATDRYIVDALNHEAALVFDHAAPLNHVLAQVYHNRPADTEKKQVKARISSHADKTKDMPGNGIIAFCTFYQRQDGQRPAGGYTRLRFRRKGAGGEGTTDLPTQFTVTLHPDSVFLIPLSTNQLYTHEIVPSELDAARLPTRLGYVVRCSNADAVYTSGRTFLATPGGRVPLEDPTDDGLAELRRLYAEENTSQANVDYGGQLAFSMNQGDYRAPTRDPADDFRVYALPGPPTLFAELAQARFEDVGKGRRGAVIVAIDGERGVPIVRTTTAYAQSAMPFRPIDAWLAGRVRDRASLSLGFNNALVEAYTGAYTTMGAHSDQALDLAEGSEIAIFSCYDSPEAGRRTLVVEAKERGGETFSIPLAHGSVVVFSAETNRRYRHRIILDPAAGPAGTWLGVTFRTSKTFVRLRDGQPRLPDGTPLTLADEAERRELYRLRHAENVEPGFVYPRVTFTLSPSDLLPPGSPVTSGVPRSA